MRNYLKVWSRSHEKCAIFCSNAHWTATACTTVTTTTRTSPKSKMSHCSEAHSSSFQLHRFVTHVHFICCHVFSPHFWDTPITVFTALISFPPHCDLTTCFKTSSFPQLHPVLIHPAYIIHWSVCSAGLQDTPGNWSEHIMYRLRHAVSVYLVIISLYLTLEEMIMPHWHK